MSHIQPKSIDEVPELKGLINKGASTMGFMPNDALILAHCPDILRSLGLLIQSTLGSGKIEARLKRLIGYVVSQSHGCTYCASHTSHSALKFGCSEQELAEVWQYESSASFSEDEKAALHMAVQSSMHPNVVNSEDFDRLKQHFNGAECVEIVSTIALYSYLNTFNQTCNTSPEALPWNTYKRIQNL